MSYYKIIFDIRIWHLKPWKLKNQQINDYSVSEYCWLFARLVIMHKNKL